MIKQLSEKIGLVMEDVCCDTCIFSTILVEGELVCGKCHPSAVMEVPSEFKCEKGRWICGFGKVSDTEVVLEDGLRILKISGVVNEILLTKDEYIVVVIPPYLESEEDGRNNGCGCDGILGEEDSGEDTTADTGETERNSEKGKSD